MKPPNGVWYRTDECELTERLPLSTPRATRNARPTSRVQIEPGSLYSESLASRVASASSSDRAAQLDHLAAVVTLEAITIVSAR